MEKKNLLERAPFTFGLLFALAIPGFLYILMLLNNVIEYDIVWIMLVVILPGFLIVAAISIVACIHYCLIHPISDTYQNGFILYRKEDNGTIIGLVCTVSLVGVSLGLFWGLEQFGFIDDMNAPDNGWIFPAILIGIGFTVCFIGMIFEIVQIIKDFRNGGIRRNLDGEQQDTDNRDK